MENEKQHKKEIRNVGRSQQLTLLMDMEICIPEAAPRILFGILVFGAMNETYSSRKLEEACRYDTRYMWLLEGSPAPDHTTIARFRSVRLLEVIDGLFAQLMEHLAEMGEIDYEHLFVDGTKLEARANRVSQGMNAIETLDTISISELTEIAKTAKPISSTIVGSDGNPVMG